MSNLCDSFCDKVIEDLVREFNDCSITEFEIVPTPASENKNRSPVIREGYSLGLESWAIRHILPYANRKILELSSKSMPETLGPFLLVANLLVPDMSTAWNRRKELISKRRMSSKNDLRLTRLALSRKPKNNEALAHRRWLIVEKQLIGDDRTLLKEELELVNLLADRYHSNYHAWTHRQWALYHLAPVPKKEKRSASILSEITKTKMYCLFNSTFLPIYVSELETNNKFISTHVSDHSGLHHRKFILSQVTNVLLSDNYEELSCRTNSDVEEESLLFYNKLVGALADLTPNEQLLHVQLHTYLNTPQNKVSAFDLVMGLLMLEIKLNSSLNALYLDHEALWYFRRFLILECESLLLHLKKFCNNNNESDSFNNPELSTSAACCCSNCQIIVLYATLIHDHENSVVKQYSSTLLRSVTNYSKWFKQVSRIRRLQ